MDENFNLLNGQQKLAVEAQKLPLLIIAGAGTGKTRTLTSRVIHFIDSGMPPERVCAITFTNKATKEMAVRISNFGYQTSGVRRPFIGTFHSLGARILRKEARLAGRKPHAMSLFNNEELEEERRLMYVAMTRAKKELAVSFSGEPPRLISEMPRGLLESESMAFTSGTSQGNTERCTSYE